MLGSGATDITVASIAGFSTIAAAAMAAYAVLASMRNQKQPKIVELSHDEKDKMICELQQQVRTLEMEAKVWKKIALDRGEVPDFEA